MKGNIVGRIHHRRPRTGVITVSCSPNTDRMGRLGEVGLVLSATRGGLRGSSGGSTWRRVRIAGVFFPGGGFGTTRPRSPYQLYDSFCFECSSYRASFFSSPSLFAKNFTQDVGTQIGNVRVLNVRLLLRKSRYFARALRVSCLSYPGRASKVYGLQSVFRRPRSVVMNKTYLLFYYRVFGRVHSQVALALGFTNVG